MSKDWTAKPQDDLPAALAEFREALPSWWYTLGECNVSCHASCGPDSNGQDAGLLRHRLFDSGLNADLAQPSTLAEALRDVTQQGLAAIRALPLEDTTMAGEGNG